MKKTIQVASLFSGIGGFETGLFQAFGKDRVQVVFSSEIDDHANRGYEALYGHPTSGDVTKIKAKEVPSHDLLVGGFPCQAFSIGGKRRGFEDTRGTLFFEIARIVDEKRPRVLLLENVKGLVSHDEGKTLEVIVRTLSDLGYSVDFQVLNSKFFFVPQNRERLYIVALKDHPVERWEKSVKRDAISRIKRSIEENGVVKSFNFAFPKQEKTTVTLQDIIEKEVDERYYVSEERLERYVHTQKEEPKPAPLNKMKQLGYVGKNAQGNRVYDASGIAPTVSSQTGGLGGSGGGVFLVNKKGQAGRRIRKLSASECLALQGFPPTVYQTLKEAGISESQIYKMAGNAVTTNVVEAMAHQLAPYLS